MTHIKVGKKWYHYESLTNHDKMRLGIWPKDSKEEIIEELEQRELDKKIMKDLSETPKSVKETPCKNAKGKKKVTKD